MLRFAPSKLNHLQCRPVQKRSAFFLSFFFFCLKPRNVKDITGAEKPFCFFFFFHANISVFCCDAFWMSPTGYRHTYWEGLSVQTMLMVSFPYLKYETSNQHSFSVTACVRVWWCICVCMSASIIWFPVTSRRNCCNLTLQTLLNMFISMPFMPGLCAIQNWIENGF